LAVAAAAAAAVIVGVGAARVIDGRLDAPPPAAAVVTSAPTGATAGTVVSRTVAAEVASTVVTAGSAQAGGAAIDAGQGPALQPGDQLVVVDVPAGMRLARVWVVDGAGVEGPAASVDGGTARFAGLAAGNWAVRTQVETGVIAAGDGVAISASTATEVGRVTVPEGASIVVAVNGERQATAP
jgi:hypothetical protein